jgi:hypothetical protein
MPFIFKSCLLSSETTSSRALFGSTTSCFSNKPSRLVAKSEVSNAESAERTLLYLLGVGVIHTSADEGNLSVQEEAGENGVAIIDRRGGDMSFGLSNSLRLPGEVTVEVRGVFDGDSG